MKKITVLVATVIMSTLLGGKPAAAQSRVIVRDTLGIAGLNLSCLLAGCSVAETLDGTEGQLFLVTSSGLSLTSLLDKVLGLVGVVDAEPDQILQVVQSQTPTAPPGLFDTTPVNYYGTTAWDGYVNQPAVQMVNLPSAQSALGVTGAGVVGMIDTGVDPTQPVLQGVLLQGYDFTRNQAGGSELTDVNQSTMAVVNKSGSGKAPANVNQSTMAVVNQAAATDFSASQYAAFGHGTMTAGVVHLVAPTAKILPLKAFSSDGSGYLSNVIAAVYWGTQHGANVFNMSFDFTTASNEMGQAVNYAAGHGVVSVASVGNNGAKLMVYPAAQANVMGVASVSDAGTLSTFSNFGTPPTWVAAPGEAIISTYPFATYAAGWGTSFAAPFVAGTAALLRGAAAPSLLLDLNTGLNQSLASQAISKAQNTCGSGCGYGILNIYQAVNSWEGLLLGL